MASEKRRDLIDRNRLLRDPYFQEDRYPESHLLRMAVREQPTVDAVEVVHEKWVGTQYDGYADGCPVYDLWECSYCREEYESEGDPPPFNCCPNCGAKMDGERKDND